MENVNLIDLLLNSNIDEINKIKKEVEITRLSNALNCKFLITCHALTMEQVEHLREINKTDMDIKINTILEACEIQGHKLTNTNLVRKYNVDTPKELVEKMFLVGEISYLYEEVSKLSGYGRDSVKEVKNS